VAGQGVTVADRRIDNVSRMHQLIVSRLSVDDIFDSDNETIIGGQSVF
jgi:hypothetical protein